MTENSPSVPQSDSPKVAKVSLLSGSTCREAGTGFCEKFPEVSGAARQSAEPKGIA